MFGSKNNFFIRFEKRFLTKAAKPAGQSFVYFLALSFSEIGETARAKQTFAAVLCYFREV